MAIVDTFSQKKDKDEGSQELGGQAITSSSALGGDTGGATTSGGQKGSGLFTNIQDYINANKGAGQKLASGIEKTGQGDVQKVQQNIAGTQQLEQDIGAEQNRVNQAGQMAQQIATNPIDAAKNNLNEINQLRTGQSNIQNLQQQQQNAMRGLQQGTQNLQQLGDQVGTEQGRFDLLRRTYGKPGYSQGSQRLDQLFLQTEGDRTLDNLQQNVRNVAQQGMQAAQDRGAALTSQLGDLQAGIGDAQTQIQSALGGFGADGGGALGGLYGDLSQAQLDAQARQEDLFKRASEQFAVGNIDADIAQSLGIDGPMRTYGVNLGDFANNIQRADSNITMADAASEDQLARLDALRQLSGLGENDTNIGLRDGGAGITFNDQAFRDAVGRREQEYLGARDSEIDRLAGLYEDEFRTNIDYGIGGGMENLGRVFDIDPVTGQANRQNVIDILEGNRSLSDFGVSDLSGRGNQLQNILDQYNVNQSLQIGGQGVDALSTQQQQLPDLADLPTVSPSEEDIFGNFTGL